MSAAARDAERVRSSRLFIRLPSRSSTSSGVTWDISHNLKLPFVDEAP